MKTAPEILAEIDRQIKVRLGAERDAVYLLNELKQFILSEPEKCEHEWEPSNIETRSNWEVCKKCGANKSYDPRRNETVF